VRVSRPEVNVVPAPSEVVVGGPSFDLGPRTTIGAGELEQLGKRLRAYLAPATGLALPFAGRGADQITLRIDRQLHESPEGYRLEVRADGVEIVGAGEAGVFYGIQTLRQLLSEQIYADTPVSDVVWRVPGVVVVDAPRFAWRGALLDVSRHFFLADYVRRFIDLLAVHKFNTLQLHLTDDQGWRLEIAAYPRLTEIGAWREGSMVGHHREALDRNAHDGVRHGGYYTHRDIQELVAYAAERHVTLVPEVELLGHAQAAIAAYPWLGSTGQQLAVATGWGVSPHVLKPSPRTLAFCREVLDEVFSLFPGSYIHVGGDECPTDEWQVSPEVQQQIRELGLADEAQLQGWFLGELGTFAASRGRTMIGWDEIVEGGLPANSIVMSWRDEEGGITAVRRGHRVVMTPQSHTYFDHYQSHDRDAEPLAIGGCTDIRAVYDYEPIPEELVGVERDRVLGSQFQLWTEYIRTPSELEYGAFPRACAFAEVVWAEQRDADGFFGERLQAHLGRLRRLDVKYREAS